MHIKQKQPVLVRALLPLVTRFRLIVGLTVLLTLLLGSGLGSLRIENDLMFMLPDQNPAKVLFMDTEEIYGNSTGIVLAIHAADGIYDKRLLKVIQEATQQIQRLNVMIPAKALSRRTGMAIPEALVLVSYLRGEVADSRVSHDAALESIQGGEGLMDSLLDAYPPFLDPDQAEETCETASRGFSDALKSDPGFLSWALDMLTAPTDRRGAFRGAWVDEVATLTEIDAVWPELAVPEEGRALLADIGIENPQAADALIREILERGLQEGPELLTMLQRGQDRLEKAGLSQTLQQNLLFRLSERSAQELLNRLRELPKQVCVGRAFEAGPEPKEKAVHQLARRLQAWPLFEKTIRSSDDRSTLILIRTIPNIDRPNRSLLLREVRSIIQSAFEGTPFSIHMAGEPIIDEEVAVRMVSDILWLLPLVLGVIVLFLAISMKTVAGVAYPLLTVVLSVVWTLGAMAWVGRPISVVSTVLPVLLVAIGSAYGIHLVHFFQQSRDAEDGSPIQKAVDTLRVTGSGVLMAGLTTVAGFGSLGFNDIVPLRDFGLFLGLGVCFALIISLCLIPALLIRYPGAARTAPDRSPTSADSPVAGLEKTLKTVCHFSATHKALVVILVACILGVSLVGLSRVRVEVNNIAFFKEGSKIRQDDAFINRHFAGTSTVSLLLKGASPHDVLDGRVLQSVDALAAAIQERHPEVGKVLSPTDLIKKMHQALHFSDPSHYRIPEKEDLDGEQSHEALRRYNAAFLDKFPQKETRPLVNEDKSEIVLAIQVTSGSSRVIASIQEDIATLMAGPLGDPLRRQGITYRVTGIGSLYLEANGLVVWGQIRSIAVSLCIVLILVGFLSRSLKIGFLSVLPLFLTLLITFGVMGFLDIPLDVATAITACIAIGIGVDYSVHFLNRYRLVRQGGSSPLVAIEATALSSGRPIAVNALSVTLGFMVLFLSSFVPLIHLGMLIALTMVVSALSSLAVLPAAIMVLENKQIGF